MASTLSHPPRHLGTPRRGRRRLAPSRRALLVGGPIGAALLAIAGIPAMTTAATDALRGPQAEIAPPTGDLPAIPAAAYLVLDGDTGDTLASYNADQSRPVASLTKLMTARLVLDEGALDESRAGLLQAMLIASDNDAARDLAVDVAGSERRFVSLMNAEAAAAGLDDTRYANPHGLDDPDQHSSAADVAHLARELMGDPIFRQIVAAENTQADGSGSPTTNDLLGTYPGADGIKTGHTDEAGLCLAASATRDGQSVIAVVLGAPTEQARDDAARALLDHGFRQAGVTDLGDAADGAPPPAPPAARSSPSPPTRTSPPGPAGALAALSGEVVGCCEGDGVRAPVRSGAGH